MWNRRPLIAPLGRRVPDLGDWHTGYTVPTSGSPAVTRAGLCRARVAGGSRRDSVGWAVQRPADRDGWRRGQGHRPGRGGRASSRTLGYELAGTRSRGDRGGCDRTGMASQDMYEVMKSTDYTKFRDTALVDRIPLLGKALSILFHEGI